ncbi:MAG: multicopper oxidase family protein [Acidimicrobiia bacterium]|nr:multicopper oxidase family protein [Acidimicrobiia bacterium]
MRTPLSFSLSSSVATLGACFIALFGSVPCLHAQSAVDEALPRTVPLREAQDRNPDPRVVEVDLTARVARVKTGPSQSVEAWTYDGDLPGPLIRTKVGDRLIVHFKNALPQPTTVHWHGIRVPIQMDGVPGISQPDVEPGGSFTYDFVVPDAGLYWYHPHVMSAAQVGFGLYGAVLVEDPNDGITIDKADQQVLVLSDIAIQDDGTLEPPDSGGDAGNVFGREGQIVLVNGRVSPSVSLRAGTLQRWRIVNTAKSRYFQLVLDGQPFTIVGVDGGLTTAPVTRDQVVIAAGERVDLLVAPQGKPGGQLVLRGMPYDRGYGSSEFRAVEDLVTFNFTNEPALPNAARPNPSRPIESLSAEGATRVSLELTLVGVDGKSEFQVNGVPFWKSKPIAAKPGETQLWTITNKVKWAHPMHMHGFFFQLVDEAGKPIQPIALKDTVDVPINKTVRYLIKFDDREGEWMFHCHILDHAEAGLMGTVRLGNPPPSDIRHTHR